MTSLFLLFLLCMAAVAIVVIVIVHSKGTEKLHAKIDELESTISLKQQQYQRLHGKATQLNNLYQKYKPIHNVDVAVEERKRVLGNIQTSIDKMLSEGEARKSQIIDGAKTEARTIVDQARAEAVRNYHDALQAEANRQENERTLVAIKNTIAGYGEEYLVPAQSILDELADDWGHKEAGEQLKRVRAKSREMVKAGESADCDYKEASRKENAIHFVIDAFNGKVDAILSKVKHDNFGKLYQQVEDVFSITNKNGEAFRNARITKDYLTARQAELRWAVAVHELRLQEREEQRAIREAMREEERARKECEKAQKAAEKEEKLLADAMKKAQSQLASAHAEQREKIEAELERLKIELAEAHERGVRAVSMAQQTKRGHVYIISNIGSFGDDVFKIGMTRRLEPLERVKELGDASVPFAFDVHAMIFSEDAPALENSLHRQFSEHQVNKVNSRKEFFRIPLTELHKSFNGEHEVHWTLHAEAREYRETKAIESQQAVVHGGSPTGEMES